MRLDLEPIDDLHQQCVEARQEIRDAFTEARERVQQWEPGSAPRKDPMYETIRADEARAGDLWLANETDHIRITAVELTTDEAFAHHGQGCDVARISGRIVKGWGRGPKVHSWTKLASDRIEVVR